MNNDASKLKNEWMNRWINEQMNEWKIEWTRLMNEWIIWVNESKKKRITNNKSSWNFAPIWEKWFSYDSWNNIPFWAARRPLKGPMNYGTKQERSGSTFLRFYVPPWIAGLSEPSLRPQSPLSGRRALSQGSEPCLRPQSPLSGHRALSQASEPSHRPQGLWTYDQILLNQNLLVRKKIDERINFLRGA